MIQKALAFLYLSLPPGCSGYGGPPHTFVKSLLPRDN